MLWSQRDNSSTPVQTTAETWGELKQKVREVDFTNIKGVIRETKASLELDDAKLPNGKYTIFLLPQKVKSGNNDERIYRTKSEYLKDFNSKTLRGMCSKRGLGTKGTKEDFAQKLANDDARARKESHKVNEELIDVPLKSEKRPELPATRPTPASSLIKVNTGTATVNLEAEITDENLLNQIMDQMFPALSVVEIEAKVSIKATLGISDIKLPVAEEKPVENTFRRGSDPVDARVENESGDGDDNEIHGEFVSDDDLKKEASQFNKLFR